MLMSELPLGTQLGDKNDSLFLSPDSGVTDCCNLIGDKIGDLKAGDDLSENIGLVTLPKLYARHWPWMGLEENCPDMGVPVGMPHLSGETIAEDINSRLLGCTLGEFLSGLEGVEDSEPLS